VSKLRILYIGTISGTCLDRAHAYRRLGHDVTHWDMRRWLPSTPWVDRITWRIGGHTFSPWLRRRMRQALHGVHFDVCHVDNGEWMTPSIIDVLKQHGDRVINYNIDDPTGPRDRRRFSAYRLAASHYDLLTVVRPENVPECQKLGARQVLRVWRSADELAHAPRSLDAAVQARWQSDVLFLGTWMPERGPFLLDLVKRGVPLSIRGANWDKAPEWPQLQAYWRGGPLSGDDYAHAIQCARINLGLLSKGNRDRHTTRSLEIPSLGGLLCAERTDEHLQLYQEGVEAAFWSDAASCADQCLRLLADEPRRLAMAQAGHRRFLSSPYGNEAVLSQIIESACAP
jgi:spore maturation protein CgeB